MASMRGRVFLAAVALAASPGLAATGFFAGQWEHETKLTQADVPGIPEWLVKIATGHGTRRSCNSAAELASHPETLFKADDTAVCKLRKLTMANGKLTFDTFCTNKHFPDGLLVSSHGTYTPISYSISTTSAGTKGGKPVHIQTTETGKRVSGTCRKAGS